MTAACGNCAKEFEPIQERLFWFEDGERYIVFCSGACKNDWILNWTVLPETL
jgi:hypothetical protein